jgi:tellurite resistance protein TerB
MALWNKLREHIPTIQKQLMSKKSELKSGGFRNASMAMCALVAAADGNVDPSERQRTATLITSNEVLSNFPPDDLQRRFEGYVAKLGSDFEFGKVGLLQEIGAVKKNPTEARAVIQIGIIIGGADGHFDENEKAVVREACHAVGLPPSEFEL